MVASKPWELVDRVQFSVPRPFILDHYVTFGDIVVLPLKGQTMHDLPLWFLWTSIFLPRVALCLGWFDHWTFPIPQPIAGLFWLLLPRILIVFMIYTSMGMGTWFWAHTLVAALVYLGSGKTASGSSN